MSRLLLWVVDRPAVAAALLVGVSAILASQVPRIEMDTSAESFMVEKDPARAFYEEAKRKFGSDNLTVVLVKADDVFAPAALRAVKRLSDALEGLDGVSRVESLTTVKNIRGDDGALNTDPLIGRDIPSDPAALAAIRADALGNRVFVPNLVAPDGRATAVVAYTAGGAHFNRHFTQEVERLIAQVTTPGLRIFQMGEPFAKTTYASYIERDQLTLIPLSIAVLLLVLFLAFRTLEGMLIPLITGVVSIVWTVGIMALIGIPLNAMTAAVPSLLIAIGFTEDVHMVAAYEELVAHGLDKLTAIRTMLRESGLPLLVTSATTVLGFLTLVFTDITGLVQFGWASSIGLTANFVITMLGVPLLLMFWPVPRRVRHSAAGDAPPRGVILPLMEWLAGFIVRQRRAVWLVTVLVTLASLAGWYSLRVDTDFMSYFPERSEIRQRSSELHRSLAGANLFYLVVDTGMEDGVKNPRVLRAIAGLQDYLARTGRVDASVSVADYLRKMHREMHAGDRAFEVIPDSPDLIAQYLLLLEGKDLGKYVDFNGATANIVVRHDVTSSFELNKLLAGIDGFVASTFPRNVRVRATGESILVNNAADYMAVNEFTSFGSTLLIIGVIHALLFMSLRAGGLSLIPNVLPIISSFGIMGLLNIPLNTGTAFVATVAIGIAVDDTVHHMVTYNRQLNLHHDQTRAMVETLRSEGRPIIYVSLALAAGFFVLMFSSFVPTRQLGFLSGLVMLLAMVAELVLTPLLMHSTRLVTLWNVVQVKMAREVVRTAPLLRGLSTWEARKIVLLGGLRSLRAGEHLVRKGEAGRELYMVVSGSLRAYDVDAEGGEVTFGTHGSAAMLGEVAVLGDGVRSANLVAESDTEVLVISDAALDRIQRRFPFTAAKLYRNIATVLCERLRDSTEARLVAQAAQRKAEAGSTIFLRD
ncbi:MAG TPA: MMPL family transporter [Methylomirabilota bacterium]